MSTVPVRAQGDATLQRGLHYYVLENRDTGQIVQRGTTGSAGVAFDQLIVAPNTRYRIRVLQAGTLLNGRVEVTSGENGGRMELPVIRLGTDLSPDTDADGLNNDGEFIMGTAPNNRDTDGDGILDGAEVQQGTDPLSGLAARTGLTATADTPGTAQDICAINDIAVLADGASGIAIFNVFNGMNPVLIGQVDTPGIARAVACAGNLAAVADEAPGLTVVDFTDPPAARIVQQVNLGAVAQAVATAGSIAYVGLANGQLVAVDLTGGTVLDRVTLGTSAVHDIALGGDTLYALDEGRLFALPLEEPSLRVAESVASPGDGAIPRNRLFVGGGLAYAIHRVGFNVFSLENPLAPALVRSITTSQFGWKQIVANGSGLALAATGPNSSDDGPHEVSLYNLNPGGTNDQFQTTFVTPGIATALSIYNGIGYVADGMAGLQVINYLAFDASNVPPAIALSASFPLSPAQAEEGKLVRVTASVSDDVQVRNVEFYVDGAKVVTDGNFPFEHRFLTPLRSSLKTSFLVRARASDTGGNATWSDDIEVTLLSDATPPRVTRILPADGAILGSADALAVYFSEPIDTTTLNADSFRLVEAGPDGAFGSNDDVTVSSGTISYRDNLNAAVLAFATPLPRGLYHASVRAPVADRAGSSLSAAVIWTFRVLGEVDNDDDGLNDELETLLGLNPNNSDSNGDGIRDGDEDFDNDRLSNAAETVAGTDPRNAHTINPVILDGDLDADDDALSLAQEIRLHTNPYVKDTDGDGWSDEAEVTGSGDPLDKNSRPQLFLVAPTSMAAVIPTNTGLGELAEGATIAQPSMAAVIPTRTGLGELAEGATVGQPPVQVQLNNP
ncbi:MAG: Ig-like domain-containing protein [Verrucomicrobia bacterium]|nr:Ig-like domain-containing protein [Verrucomicrobiota bacterium]